MALSKSQAELLQRIFIWTIIMLFAVPVMLPFVWLISSSLKTSDKVLTSKPEFLPWVEEQWVKSKGREVRINIVNENKSLGVGCWRLKLYDLDKQNPFTWPDYEIRKEYIRQQRAPIFYRKNSGVPLPYADPNATIDSLQKRYGKVVKIHETVKTISPPAPDGTVEVEIVGKPRHVLVRPEQITNKRIVTTELEAFGLNIRVRKLFQAGPFSFVKVVEPSKPFVISDRLVFPLGGTEFVLITNERDQDALFRARRLEHYQAAKVSLVEILPGEWISRVKNLKLRTIPRMHYYLKENGKLVEVKRVHLDAKGRPTEVAVLGQPRRVRIPAAVVKDEKPLEVGHITVLDQDVTVRITSAPDQRGLVVIHGIAPRSSFSADPSVVDQRRLLRPQWRNYIDIWKRKGQGEGSVALADEPIWYFILNSVFVTSLNIIGNILACGLVGYAFARMQFRGKNILFIILLATMMLPAQVTMIPTYVMWIKIGALDTFIPLILPSFLSMSAFFVFLYRQFFMAIPLDLEDAARIDGCGPFGTFWHIFLPMAKPTVVTVAVFTFMASWNDFLRPLLYLNTPQKQTLALALYTMKSSMGYDHPHWMMSITAVMMMPTIVIFFLAQKAFMRGVVVSGVKG